LRAGLVYRAGSLRNLADSIFEELSSQTNNELEGVFLLELRKDVLAMVDQQEIFYLRMGSLVADVETASNRNLLKNQGYYLTSVSLKSLEYIGRIAENHLNGLRQNALNGLLERNDLSVNSGSDIRKIVRVLNAEFGSSGVLKSLGSIFDQRAKVIGVALELSVPGAQWSKVQHVSFADNQTRYAHVDRAVDAPKAIVYLTNVREKNGPTMCYPGVYESLKLTGIQDFIGRCIETIGTNKKSLLHDYYRNNSSQALSSEQFRSHFMKLPPEMRMNSHFGWDILPGTALEDFVVSRTKKVIGEAGTTIVFDGARLLHRGGLIEEEERVVLQVVFGYTSIRVKTKQAIQMIIRYFRSVCEGR